MAPLMRRARLWAFSLNSARRRRSRQIGRLKFDAIAPDEERFFAKRMKAKTTELNASHVSMLSQPKAVAAVIMDAAEKAAESSVSPASELSATP